MTRLLSDEIAIFEESRETRTKGVCLKLQRIYLKYEEDERSCMCTKTTRAVKHRQFYDWYDKERS